MKVKNVFQNVGVIDIQDIDTRAAYLFDTKEGLCIRNRLGEIGYTQGSLKEFIVCMIVLLGANAPRDLHSAMIIETRRSAYIAWRVGDGVIVRPKTPTGVMDFLKSAWVLYDALLQRGMYHDDGDIKVWSRAMDMGSKALKRCPGDRTTFTLCDLIHGKALCPSMKKELLKIADYLERRLVTV